MEATATLFLPIVSLPVVMTTVVSLPVAAILATSMHVSIPIESLHFMTTHTIAVLPTNALLSITALFPTTALSTLQLLIYHIFNPQPQN